MRILGRAFLALLVATGLFAQGRTGFSGAAPRMTGGFGSVVFPGGTSATTPGIQRSFGSVVFPGGGGPQLIVPNRGTGLLGGSVVRRNYGVAYAYPVYVGGYYGGYYDGSYLYPADQSAAQAPPAQNITVVYPPAPAPLMLNPLGGGDAQAPGGDPGVRSYQPAEDSAAPPPEQPYYLLAFKDHTIYSTPAYWVDGDTIHYFTAGNKHNQASVSLVDRDLTARLNRESGVEVKLPAEK
jgi:hypothetical protein